LSNLKSKIHACREKLAYVLCTKDGYLNGTDLQFCIKGKYYPIIGTDLFNFEIIDELGNQHIFTKKDTEWFDCL